MERQFLPDPISGKCVSDFHAGSHVADAFREWVKRNHLSLGDANVVINLMGSLAKIIAADQEALESIPVNSSTKAAMINFFSASKNSSTEKDMHVHNYYRNSETHFGQEKQYGKRNELGFAQHGQPQMKRLKTNPMETNRLYHSPEFQSSNLNMSEDLGLDTFNFSQYEAPRKHFQNNYEQGGFTTRRTDTNADYLHGPARTGQNIYTSIISNMPSHEMIHEEQHENGYSSPFGYQYN